MTTDSLIKIAEEVAECTKCPLYKSRTKGVPGDGSPTAEIMFIGEGPGKNEDLQGKPFVGAAGKYLDELLAMIKIKRADVYIANVIKSRPPGNRDPLPEEVAACWPYLERQLRLIRPKLIVTLGRHAMARFIKIGTITENHGRAFRLHGQVYFPTYHPAAALYRGALRTDLEADFKKIPVLLKKITTRPSGIISGEEEKKKEEQGELSL